MWLNITLLFNFLLDLQTNQMVPVLKHPAHKPWLELVTYLQYIKLSLHIKGLRIHIKIVNHSRTIEVLHICLVTTMQCKKPQN